MRKPPKIHRVKSHKREGKTVHSYIRGVKKQNIHITKPTVPQKPKGYTVKLTYSGGKTETIKVIATTYQRAIDEAFEEKTDKRLPIEISVVDPSLGEIIHWAGSRALKYGKAVISKSYEFAKSRAMVAASDWETKRLIEEAYSENRGKRILARTKLKHEHPEVWDIMDISRS